jgi:hypothetical protein
MQPRHRRSVFAFVSALFAFATISSAQTPRLPERLTDAEFWTLVSDISEPGGTFRNSDNFTSNEIEVGAVFTALRAARVSGGAYIGVGPEQNFSYIASIRPQMAFVIDIRRQAVVQHLMFKAIFELSKDRADFISMLFSRPRPAGLDSATSIQRMWDIYRATPIDAAMRDRNGARIEAHLRTTRRFALTPDELDQLHWVWDAFNSAGPNITTQLNQGGRGGGGGGGRSGGFANMTAAADTTGQIRSFLSSEENYRYVKALHEKNLIVPVSGDFAGPKALRGIGAYLRSRAATVTAYYVSNVEQYLYQDGKQAAFYANVATLPLTDQSVFIRPYAMRNYGPSPAITLCPINGYLRAFTGGRASYYEASLTCAK